MENIKSLIDLIISTINKKATVFNDFSDTKTVFTKEGKKARLKLQGGKVFWGYEGDGNLSSEFYWIFGSDYDVEGLLAALEELWERIKYSSEEDKQLFELRKRARALLKDIIDTEVLIELDKKEEQK